MQLNLEVEIDIERVIELVYLIDLKIEDWEGWGRKKYEIYVSEYKSFLDVVYYILGLI